jgi:hypothetical protein
LALPANLKFVEKFREIVYYLPLKLAIPKLNPKIICGMTLITSLLAVILLNYSFIFFFFMLVATLLLDWLESLAAKKHNLLSEEAYACNIMSDRLSESLLFIFFFSPWFILFLLNCLLTFVSLKRGKHLALPLRHFFLIYLIFIYFI